jgi:Bacterial aa3 type cytochrome c oxidase subunit IV
MHGGAPRAASRRLGKNTVATAPSRCPGQAITLSPPAPGAMSGDDGMADHGEVEYATAEGNDYAAHEQTYENFIRLVKVVMAIVVAIVVLMAYFLT